MSRVEISVSKCTDLTSLLTLTSLRTSDLLSFRHHVQRAVSHSVRVGRRADFGFGVLLAIWAVASCRDSCSAWCGGTAGVPRRSSALPVLLLVGAAIVFLPRMFPDGLPIRGYGVMLLRHHRRRRHGDVSRRQGGLDPEVILSLAIWLVICGVIGARLVLCDRILGRKVCRPKSCATRCSKFSTFLKAGW